MMTLPKGMTRQSATQLVSSEDPLGEAAGRRLKNEVTRDPDGVGYDTVAWPSGLLRLLNEPRTIPNPKRRRKVKLRYADIPALTMIAGKIALAAADDPAVQEAWRFEIEVLMPTLLLNGAATPSDDRRLARSLARFVEAGLITQEEADSVSEVPDPYYKETIEVSAPITLLFGERAICTLADLKAAGIK